MLPGAVVLLTVWADEGALRVRVTAADDLIGPTRPGGVAAGISARCAHEVTVPDPG